MPYIKDENNIREDLRIGKKIPSNAGELNYLMFYIIKNYFNAYDNTTWALLIKSILTEFLGCRPNYQKYNDMTGAVVRCYRELKRRYNIVADFMLEAMNEFDKEIVEYEYTKIIENGDVE